MPIIGLTDRAAAFPKIGTLRKGGQKKDEKRPGPDLTYFRFDSDDQQAAAMFRQTYGDEPRQISVYLPYAKAEENFQTWQEAWQAGGLLHRCDGQTCTIWRKGKEYSRAPQPCPGGCKPVGRLMVIVPELRRLAYVVVLTTSIHDVIELSQNLDAAQMLRGDLRGIPFILSRRPREISTPTQDGGRARREKWLLSIEPAAFWVDLQLDAMQRSALPIQTRAKSLTDSRFVDTTTGEIIEAEADEEMEAAMSASELPTQQAHRLSAPVEKIPDPAPPAKVRQVRELWARARDRGVDIPAKHLELDLEALSDAQLVRLIDQAKRWLAKAEQSQVRPGQVEEIDVGAVIDQYEAERAA